MFCARVLLCAVNSCAVNGCAVNSGSADLNGDRSGNGRICSSPGRAAWTAHRSSPSMPSKSLIAR